MGASDAVRPDAWNRLRNRGVRRGIQFALVWALTAPATIAAGGHEVATGLWGGAKAILEVTGEGADVEFECARGHIGKPISTDEKGEFDMVGTFAAEGHGPARDGDAAETKARYQGHVDGDTMTLEVTVGDRRMGPFNLTHGEQPVLRKCR